MAHGSALQCLAAHQSRTCRLRLYCNSGATEDCPAILKYACVLDTNAAPVKPALCQADFNAEEAVDGGEALSSLLTGKPLLALNFSNMVMTVDEATVHDAQGLREVQMRPSLATAYQ